MTAKHFTRILKIASTSLLVAGSLAAVSGSVTAGASVAQPQRASAHFSTSARVARPHVVQATTVFHVNTTVDNSLADPNSTTCVDTAGTCSLRAAIDASNNLDRPTTIHVAVGTYTLIGGDLSVSNAGGTSVIGAAAAKTIIGGGADGVFHLANSASSGPSTLFLSKVTVSGGTNSNGGLNEGGAIFTNSENTNAVLDNVILSNNNAAAWGGAVYNEHGNFWITNSILTDNSSEYGGAIYNYWGNMVLTNDIISGNSASWGGGAMYNGYTNLTITGGSISNNSAASQGGALWDQNTLTEISGGAKINGNTAGSGSDQGLGGAVHENATRLDISNSTISGNSVVGTSSAGGAIYVENQSEMTITKTTFASDRTGSTATCIDSCSGGGAIFFYPEASGNGSSSLTINASTFHADNTGAVNIEGEYGGADVQIANSSFTGNTAALDYGGGAMSIYSYYGGIDTVLSNDRFANNTNSGYDSAGAIETYSEEGSTSLQISKSIFYVNKSTGESGTGALATYSSYYSNCTTNIASSSFTRNTAPQHGYGGAVSNYSVTSEYANASMVINSSLFSNNSVGSVGTGLEGFGGAISNYNYAALSLLNSKVLNNRAIGSGAYGAGVFDGSFDSSLYRGDVISGNQSPSPVSYGGGIYLEPMEDATSVISQSTISNNTAQYGAGIYSYFYGLDLIQSTVSGNIASGTGGGFGGGIYSYESVISLTNSTVANNQAKGAGGLGGGMYLSYSSTSMYYSTVAGNSAATGAGTYMDLAGAGAVRDSIIVNNTTTFGGKHQANCGGIRWASLSGNVFSQANCVTTLGSHDVVTSHPGLLPLGNYGGLTRTMAITSSSPAYRNATGDKPANDQRGVARSGSISDSGAFQL